MSELELKVGLVVAVAALVAMVYALTQGELWNAGVLALSGVVLMRVYRIEKRRLEEQP